MLGLALALTRTVGGSSGGGGGSTPVYTAPTIAAVGTYAAAGAATLTVPMAAGYQAGDIALLIRESQREAAITPSGYTALMPSFEGTVAANAAIMIEPYTKPLASSSGETDPTFAAPVDHHSGLMLLLRGCAATPIAVQAEEDNNIGTTTPYALPAVTTPLPNCRIIYIVGRATDSAAAAFGPLVSDQLTDITEHFDGGTTEGSGGGFAVFSALAPAAGLVSATMAHTTSGNQVRKVIVLNPVAA